MVKKALADNGKKHDADTFRVIALTMGDTTWRMFVPTIGFTLLGVWLDSLWGLKPWLMFGGIVIGFASAYLLVAKQLSYLKKQKDNKR